MTDGDGSVTPGWYPDPADPTRLRRWDGQGWTADVVLAQEAPVATPPEAIIHMPDSAASNPLFSDAPDTPRAAPPTEAAPPPATPTPPSYQAPPNYQIPPAYRPPAANATAPAQAPERVDPEPIPTAGSPEIPDWANLPGLTLPPDLSSIDGILDHPGLKQPKFDDVPPAAAGPQPLLRPLFEEPAPARATPELGEDVPGEPSSRRDRRAQESPERPAQARPAEPSAPYAPPPSGALYSAPPPPGVPYSPPPAVALPASSLPPAAPRVLPGESRLIPSRLVEQSRLDADLPVLQPAPVAPVARPTPVQSAAISGSGTAGVWLMAVLPLLQFAAVYAIFGVLNQTLIPGIQWGILAIPALFSLLFAAADRRKLLDLGHPRVPNAALGIVAPIYLIARCVLVGPRSIPPLVVWIILQAGAIAGTIVLLPTVLAAAIASSS